MARTDTLGHFLTDVADAIRTKKGSSDTIQASNFDTEIENLPSGADLSDYFTPTISDGNSNVPGYLYMIKTIPNSTTVSGTSLSYAFYNFRGTAIPLLDTSNVVNMSNMFQNSHLTTIPLLDTSNVTTMTSMFSYCSHLTTIPLLDTSNVTNMNSMFRDCTSLTEIPLLNTSNVTTIKNIFNGCTNLTTIPILDFSKVGSLNYSFAFNKCPSLTDTSLDNILQMCIGINASSTSKNLAYMGFKATNYPTSRIEALPHYQDFIDAGWTIGY